MKTKSYLALLAVTLVPLSSCDSAGGPAKSSGVLTDKTTPAAAPTSSPSPSPIPSPVPSPTSTTTSLDGTWKFQYDVCGTTVTSLPYNHYLDISGSQLIIRTRTSDGSSYCAGSNPTLIESVSYDGTHFDTTPVQVYDYAGNCANPTLNYVTGPQDSHETYTMTNATTLVIFSATNCGTSGAPKRTYYYKQ